MINSMDSIQYIMDIKKAHDEIGYIGLGIMGKPWLETSLQQSIRLCFMPEKLM